MPGPSVLARVIVVEMLEHRRALERATEGGASKESRRAMEEAASRESRGR